MKRLFIAYILLALTVPMWAQSRSDTHSKGFAIDVSVGAGYTRLGYKAASPAADVLSKTTGGFGYDARLAFDFFFSEYFGIGLGADVSRYAGATRLDGTLRWTDVTDTDGERYEHLLALDKWTERQQLTLIEPELMLLTSVPVGGVYLSAGVGMKYSWGVSSTYLSSGTLTHTGYYDKWNLTLADMDAHGFYTESGYAPQGKLSTPANHLFLVAKAGVLIPLVKGLDLQVHAYGAFALTGRDEVGGEELLGFRDDRPGMQDAHYFMTAYQPLTTTAATTGAYRPMQVGLEVGIRYTVPWPHVKRGTPCRCMEDYY